MSACVQVSKAEEYNTQKPELLGYEEMRQMDPSVLAGGTIAFLFSFPPAFVLGHKEMRQIGDTHAHTHTRIHTRMYICVFVSLHTPW